RSIDGRVEIARCLHRFDHAQTPTLADLAARPGQIQENRIAELCLREIRDADGRGLAIDCDPFVGFAVAPLSHRPLSPSSHAAGQFESLDLAGALAVCAEPR